MSESNSPLTRHVGELRFQRTNNSGYAIQGVIPRNKPTWLVPRTAYVRQRAPGSTMGSSCPVARTLAI